MQNLIKLSSWC